MTEINGKDLSNKLSALPSNCIKKDDTTVAAENITDMADNKQVNDLGNNPQELIGRSQVAKADCLATDMKVLKENPELVLHADEFFDYALQQLTQEGQADAYEKACLATAQFINEFSKKQQVKV